MERINALLNFTDTLTPEQRELFERVNFYPVPKEAEPTPAPLPATQAGAHTGNFWRPGNAEAQPAEIVLAAVLTLVHSLNEGAPRGFLDDWATQVLAADKEEMERLGKRWRPIDPRVKKIFSARAEDQSPVMPFYNAALARYGEGHTAILETMSAILFFWPGAGRTELATTRKIDSYLRMLQPGKKQLKGFKYDLKSPGIARHLSMLPAVAALLLDRTTVGIMKTLLHKHAVAADEVKVNLNLADAFDQLERENAVQGKEIKELKLDKEQLKLAAASKQLKIDNLNKRAFDHKGGEAKVAAKYKKKVAAGKAEHAKDLDRKKSELEQVRATALEAAMKELGEEHAAKVARKEGLNQATHKLKRKAEKRADTAEELAARRLTQTKKLKLANETLLEQHAALLDKVDDLMQDVRDADEAANLTTAEERLNAMPSRARERQEARRRARVPLRPPRADLLHDRQPGAPLRHRHHHQRRRQEDRAVARAGGADARDADGGALRGVLAAAVLPLLLPCACVCLPA